MTEKQYDKQKD